jgi:predicted lysophospholipase L1 biosynthesis ABC-type transport system permease subunit
MTSLAGALLAGAATAVSLYVTGRRRLHELAALAVAGASRRTLFACTVAEIGLLLCAATVAGAVAGIVSAAFALPAVPEFPDRQPPALRYGLHLSPLVLLLVAVAVLVVSIATLAAGALVRAARPAVLREPAP